jgi:hypothetical protein
MKYFEDWLFTSDAEIGSYNYLGMACMGIAGDKDKELRWQTPCGAMR